MICPNLMRDALHAQIMTFLRAFRREEREPDCPTVLSSAARGLHVPTRLTPEPAKREARKRRANERPRVGCCEELAGAVVRSLFLGE
jgi:hypothetical protein